MNELTPLEANDLAGRGHIPVDIRPFQDFDASHPTGALSVEYSRKSFAERVSQVTTAAEPVVLVFDDPEKASHAAGQLEVAGFEVAGAIAYSDWAGKAITANTPAEIDIAALAGHAQAGAPILDIREDIEVEFLGRFPGARRIPLSEALERRTEIETDFRHDDDIVILCSAGLRSATAGSLLFRWGYSRLSHPPDGLNGWLRAGNALERHEDKG